MPFLYIVIRTYHVIYDTAFFQVVSCRDTDSVSVCRSDWRSSVIVGMGNLLRLLARDDCCSVQKYYIFLDLESKFPASIFGSQEDEHCIYGAYLILECFESVSMSVFRPKISYGISLQLLMSFRRFICPWQFLIWPVCCCPV